MLTISFVLIGQYAYVCPVRQTAVLGSAQQTAPVWLYHWAVNRTVLGGVNHADQMYYETMRPATWKVSRAQEEIALTFHAYVTSFIVSGDPNEVRGRSPSRPDWSSWAGSTSAGRTMVIGKGSDEAAGGNNKGVVAQLVEDHWAQNQCDFWWMISEIDED